MTQDSGVRPPPSARDRFSLALDRSLGAAAGLVLGALTVLTFCDVVGRYFLNSPISGAYELVELMMATLIFTALPVVTERDLHVTIDLLDHVTPFWLAPVRNLFIHLLSSVALGGIAWRLWDLAASKADYGDMTMFLSIPLHPFAYGMSVLSGVTALVSLTLAVFTVSGISRRAAGTATGRQ